MSTGEKITFSGKNEIQVPHFPIIPFIEGDGTGPDIWAASQRVFDAAVKKPTRANVVWYGKRFWLEKRPLNSPRVGYPKKL